MLYYQWSYGLSGAKEIVHCVDFQENLGSVGCLLVYASLTVQFTDQFLSG